MKKQTPKVSIVVLNWNGLEETKNCLESIRNLNYPNFEIIVVDNGSTDGSKEYLSSQKDIIFVNLHRNFGFTGGHIEGYKKSTGDFIAILNNDLVVDTNWLIEVVNLAISNNNIAVVGGKSLWWDKDNPVYSKNNQFYSYQVIDPNTGYAKTMLSGAVPQEVDSISGAALLIKRKAIEKVGYFDDDFFAYYEETDLIARMLRAGFKAYYTPNAYVWHKIAHSSGGQESYFYLYQMHRNRYLFAAKNLDDKYYKIFKKNYKKQYGKAVVKNIKNKSLDSKARIDAFKWVKKNTSLISSKREAVQSSGKSYVKHLSRHKNIDVTVVIPAYNYGNYITESIESALNQTLTPLNIIVINDGSKDDTKNVIKKYKDNPLLTIVNQENKGVISTKNIGLSLVSTYWLVFLDADDVLDYRYLEKLVRFANRGSYEVVYTDMLLFGSINETFYSKDFTDNELVKSNFIHNSALMCTTLVKQVGGYKDAMSLGLEDWELYISLAEIGARFGHYKQPIFKYRQHNDGSNRNLLFQKSHDELKLTMRQLHNEYFNNVEKNNKFRKVKTVVKSPYYAIKYPRSLGIATKHFVKKPSDPRNALHETRKYIYSANTMKKGNRWNQ